MPFTARLFFSGLGLALFHTSGADSRRHPEKVDLYTLKTSFGHQHEHVPRFSFELRDLAKPTNLPIHGLRPTPDATMMIDYLVAGENLMLKATGGDRDFDVSWLEDPTASHPGQQAKATAIDWLPSVDRLLPPGYSLHTPDRDGGTEIYSTCLSLPPGKIQSRRILFAKHRSHSSPKQAKWTFPNDPNPRIMADQLVWSSSGLESLSIVLDGHTFEFDSRMRELDQDHPILELAFTNFPQHGLTGRFGVPPHFPMYHRLAGLNSGLEPHQVDISLDDQLIPITGQGSCPPAYSEI